MADLPAGKSGASALDVARQAARAAAEIMLAAYYSAGTGRRVSLPFQPKGVKRPVDLWKNPPAGLCG